MSEGLTLLPPESDRYRAELVFVHGLWVDSRIWRGVAAGFAHRGWNCLLVDRDTSSTQSEPFSWARRVAQVVREREVPPIVIGHDAGALIALDLASRAEVRAAIAIAPLLDGTAPVQSWLGRRALQLRGDAAKVAPPDLSHVYFANLSDQRRSELAGSLGSEPAAVLRETDRLATPARPAVPAFLVAGQVDPVSSAVLAEICARGIEADFERLPGGHWPMLEPRADDWITQVHRWLIKTVGHDLLVLRGDEDLVE
jgi:pimeloyl-ACP methyl ester carboxylesterase